MPSCTLEIGGRVVARAEGGPFDAEYALFEAHEIELKSNNEPGTVREHGYATTAELALERLEAAGATAALADAVAEELGALVTTYARGAEVRRVASLLGACELFEGRTWAPQGKRYDGAWLEIAALAADLGVENAGRALQGLHLAALLRDVAPGTPIYLTTTEYTAGRRPGERTHKRVSLSAAAQLPDAIRALSENKPDRSLRDAGPARSELLEWVRARKASVVRIESTARLEALEKLLAVRERPARGPLADAELWAIEQELNEGQSEGALEKLDTLERSRGRQPGTTYLRARLALMLGTEEPRTIAERASSLALSMSAFAELELLAAEAWSRAGEKKRALAYARDLADNPQVDVGIRARARALVEPVGSPSGERPASAAPPPMSASGTAARPPVTPAPPPPATGSNAVVQITAGLRSSIPPMRMPSESPSSRSRPTPPPSLRREEPPSEEEEEPEAAPDTPIEPAPILQVRGSVVPVTAEPRPQPPPPPHAQAPAQHPTRPDVVRPVSSLGEQSVTYPMIADATKAAPVAHRVGEQTLRSKSVIPAEAYRVTPPPFEQPRPGSVQPAAPPVQASAHPSPPPPHPDTDEPPPAFVKGGSLPPFRTEPPPPNFPAAPLVPNLTNERVERAEALSLPPGLHGESVDTIPTNPWEARIYFTQLSRELGRLYRAQYNIELRTDVRSIEILQRNLAERFEGGELRTPDDEREVRLHGAFLSEILARRLGAEWVDLAVSEMGYWAMNVPPGTRVWPIGRVVRFVTMQHRERDLVSYFLELQARASGAR